MNNKQEVYLVFDLGTGNSRVALVNTDSKIIGLDSIENTYHYDPVYANPRAKYFIPKDWFSKLLSMTKGLLEQNKDISVIAATCTSAREGIVLIDKNSSATIGLPNTDGRGEAWECLATNPERVYDLSGRWVDSLFSALKLVGYHKKYPAEYENILSFTSISEWIGFELTHQIGIEASHAAETQLFDVANYNWSDELCQTFQISPDFLPTVHRSGHVLGTLTPDIMKELHLEKEIPFIITGADTAAAVRGVAGQEGDVVVVSGTTTPVVTITSTPSFEHNHECWTDCHLDGSWLIETNCGSSGMNYQHYKNNFLPDVSYGELEKLYENRNELKCVASFGTAYFRKNKSLRNGGFYMGSSFSPFIDRFDFAQAILADIACGIALNYSNLNRIKQHEKEYILGSGGGFQSPTMAQWVADLTGKKVVLRENYEQASLNGCVITCNMALNRKCHTSKVAKEYLPQSNPMISNHFETWNNIRWQINP